MAIQPLDELPAEKTIRKQLGTLATGGVEPYWVLDNCRQLVGLKCIREHLKSDPPKSDDELVDALVTYLRGAIDEVEMRQHQVLLTIVLAVEKDSEYLGQTAKSRRTAAGQLFRGGRKTVGFGVIRQHHEPRALHSLSAIVYRDERKARGLEDEASSP